MKLNTDIRAIASLPLSKSIVYAKRVGFLIFLAILLLGCSTQRAIRLRNKSIKEWESRQKERDREPSDAHSGSTAKPWPDEPETGQLTPKSRNLGRWLAQASEGPMKPKNWVPENPEPR